MAITLVCLLVLVCGVVQPLAAKEPGGKEVADKQGSRVAAIDPLGLAQDTVPVSRRMAQGQGSNRTRLVPPAKIFAFGDTLGYDSLGAQVFRVQLAMIDTYSDARRALAVAYEIFDQPVSLDYEVPYYKLRVGEFHTRAEAEMYQQRARGAGYPNAWVMLTTVSAKQVEPLYHTGDSTAADTTK
jgi:hypothetical protein